MVEQKPFSKLVGIPAPVYYATTFVIGLGVGNAMPWQPAPVEALRSTGWVLLAIGVFVGPGSAIAFALRGTTLNPAGRPSSLVTGGVFSLTRNPMYLGLAIIYAGLALMLWRFAPLLLLPVPVLLLNFLVIPFEEASLRAAFGNRFALYCRRVRRWV